MDNFSWQLPTKVIFGVGVVDQCQRYFKGYGKRALIITGKESASKHGTLAKITTQLENLSISYQIESAMSPNPTVEAIEAVIDRQQEFAPQLIVAVGGGSVLDSAKGVAIGLKNKGPLSDFLWMGEANLPKNPESALPIIAIPTMPASGSEINKNAVVTWQKNNIKSVIFHELIYPKVAIIDPSLTITLDSQQTTDTAIDIMSHALETYLSTNKSTELQDEITIGICKTVKDNLAVLLKYPEYIEARKNIFYSGMVAQSGFYRGREGGWPLHWLEHPLSARYDVSHGLGLKKLLPELIKYDLNYNQEKIERLLQVLFGSTDISALEQWLAKLPGKFTLPADAPLSDMTDDIFQLNARAGVLPNIKPMSRDDVYGIFKALQLATT